MNLKAAIKYLRDVLDHKRIIPFTVHTGGVGRHAQAKNLPGGKKAPGSKGRWPEKATRVFIDLLKNASANGENSQLEVGNLVIKHIQVNRAPKMRRRTYRAHGRINAYMSSPAHIEVICVDAASAIPKAEEEEGTFVPSRRRLAMRRVATRGD
jgi:large subunit ribosomal protein L17e